jgi:broad-specificity NMP kinase
MGVGKTATCSQLYKQLENSVWLDGDWCWMMNPFVANEENKRMVQDNIDHLLRNFLTNSQYQYVIFNWVIHQEEIFDMILSGLEDLEFETVKITLLCSEESLRKRFMRDVEQKVRKEESIAGSMERLKLYQTMDTIKIDTSDRSIEQVVDQIVQIVK